MIFRNISGLFLNYLEQFAVSKIKINGFGSHGHIPKSENHETDGFSGFPKMNPKSDQSKMKQNNSTELLGLFFKKVHNKNVPKTPRPQI